MNKKNLFKWALYDFANSFVFINFLLYFSTWLVVDGKLSDFWYNAIFPIASILLFLSAPTLASFTDKHGGRKYLLNYCTVGTFLSYGVATALAYLGAQYIYLIAFFFLLGQYFYQLSFVFYNTLIEDVADIDHRARASGIGQFFNSLGQVSGLLIALPLSATRGSRGKCTSPNTGYPVPWSVGEFFGWYFGVFILEVIRRLMRQRAVLLYGRFPEKIEGVPKTRQTAYVTNFAARDFFFNQYHPTAAKRLAGVSRYCVRAATRKFCSPSMVDFWEIRRRLWTKHIYNLWS